MMFGRWREVTRFVAVCAHSEPQPTRSRTKTGIRTQNTIVGSFRFTMYRVLDLAIGLSIQMPIASHCDLNPGIAPLLALVKRAAGSELFRQFGTALRQRLIAGGYGQCP